LAPVVGVDAAVSGKVRTQQVAVAGDDAKYLFRDAGRRRDGGGTVGRSCRSAGHGRRPGRRYARQASVGDVPVCVVVAVGSRWSAAVAASAFGRLGPLVHGSWTGSVRGVADGSAGIESFGGRWPRSVTSAEAADHGSVVAGRVRGVAVAIAVGRRPASLDGLTGAGRPPGGIRRRLSSPLASLVSHAVVWPLVSVRRPRDVSVRAAGVAAARRPVYGTTRTSHSLRRRDPAAAGAWSLSRRRRV